MRKYFIALTLFFCLASFVMADNDWSQTGKGGSAGRITPEQAEQAWAGLAAYKTLPAPDMTGKSKEDVKKLNDEISAKNDQHAMFVIEWVVINAINDAKARPVVAARLAKIATDPNVSYESKVFCCSMLFRVGTPAEVPAIAKLLADPKTADAARLFLERVPSDEATVALRAALAALEGKRESIGVMNSLSVRKDAASVAAFIKQTKSPDKAIALAAWRALSNIANAQTADFLADTLRSNKKPCVASEAAALRVAIFIDDTAKAATLFKLLGDECRGPAAQKAAAVWQYNNAKGDAKKALLTSWMKSSDPAKLNLVVRDLGTLDDATLERYIKGKDISEKLRIQLTEDLARRQGEKMIPAMLDSLKSGDPVKVRMATKFLAQYGDKRIAPAILETLGSKNERIRAIAADALSAMPKETVGAILLTALNDQPKLREDIVPILSRMKYYEAIDPLLKLAVQADPAIYEGAIEGLRGICDPDDADLGRMFDLYLKVTDNKKRDFVARAITYIAEKNPDVAARANILLAHSDKKGNKSDEYQAFVLPLFGRLGTAAVYKRIEAALKSTNPDLAAAAVLALCNWPNAEHADQLWSIVESAAPIVKNQALRAYIRVVTLPSDRSDADTLAMLKKSMGAADNDATRSLALSRAAAVRTLDTVKWAAGYLDNAELKEAAAKVIVALAHHRFLRQPNKTFFEPILKKIETTSANRETVESAEKARLGM